MTQNQKHVDFYTDALQGMKKGIETISEAVASTLGPKGKNVILQRAWGSPAITKDGVTVARDIDLKDPLEQQGALLIKEVASKTVEDSGDGTTTATILAAEMFKSGLKYIGHGANSADLRAGMNHAVSKIVEGIKELAKPVELDSEINNIAMISGNNDTEIGRLITNAVEEVGREGEILIEEGKNVDSSVEITVGYQFLRGFASRQFVNNVAKQEAQLSNCYVLVTDEEITLLSHIMPAIERAAQDKRSLLIIAPSIAGEALSVMAYNTKQLDIDLCAVVSPEFGDVREDMMRDIVASVGGVYFSSSEGQKLDNASIQGRMGVAEKVMVSKRKTIIIPGERNTDHEKAVESRIQDLREQMKDERLGDRDKDVLKLRISKLVGKIAVIKVGGVTEVAMKERRDRVDDALHATRAAIESGYVPGGGTALMYGILNSTKREDVHTDDFVFGKQIVHMACFEPLRRIAINAGDKPDVVQDRVWKSIVQEESEFEGYNGRTGEYEDLVASGIIDPAKVVITALENAASIASLLLSTSCVVTDIPQETPEFVVKKDQHY